MKPGDFVLDPFNEERRIERVEGDLVWVEAHPEDHCYDRRSLRLVGEQMVLRRTVCVPGAQVTVEVDLPANSSDELWTEAAYHPSSALRTRTHETDE